MGGRRDNNTVTVRRTLDVLKLDQWVINVIEDIKVDTKSIFNIAKYGIPQLTIVSNNFVP